MKTIKDAIWVIIGIILYVGIEIGTLMYIFVVAIGSVLYIPLVMIKSLFSKDGRAR